jgi:hypothetical protein
MPDRINPARHDVVLLLLTCFAMAWVIARACLQSVTIDEADSYLAFASADWAAQWYPSSGNHVLNTILMEIFTSVFGLSHLTLRGGSMAGAAIYLAAVYGIAVRFAHDPWVRRPLFLCLVFSPFVMDYMVAARGYSLALGLFAASLYLMARAVAEERLDWPATAASICTGLSVTANFSFAYVNAAALLVFAIWGCRRTWKAPVKTLLPAFLTANLVCGSTIWTFPRSQLYYGATSLREMWNSLAAATFDSLNPFVVNPLVARCLEFLAPVLPWAFLVLGLAQFAVVRSAADRKFAAPILAILAAALVMHWLAFRIARIPLPMARTGIFFVPLTVLLVAIAAANRAGPRLLRVSATALLVVASIYFAGCLRLAYFKEWEFDIDAKEAFAVLRDLHRREGIAEVSSDWRYSSTLNFYRRFYHDESVGPFPFQTPRPLDKRAYVLWYPDGEAFIAAQNLQLVYRSKRSDLAIALRR